MARASSAKRRQLLLLLATAAAALLLAAADAGRRRPVHLRLYMHDIIGGPNQTAIHLIHGVGPPHASLRGAYFGDTVAVDDLVTAAPGAGAAAVGRAQGTYMLASQREEVLVVAVTVALTAGPYGGSTFAVAGRVGIYDDAAEAAVGSGAPPATWRGGRRRWCPRTTWWWSSTCTCPCR
ncbi:hypothetical protein ACP4OV_012017 [Aristida adscensionis]